jgi:hypothetical protein
MTRTRAHISAVNSYFPKDRVDNAALLEKVTASFPLPNPNILERLCGIRTRHFAAAGEQVSVFPGCGLVKHALHVEPRGKTGRAFAAVALHKQSHS